MAWGPGGVVKTFVRIYVMEVSRGGENLRENLRENTVKKIEWKVKKPSKPNMQKQMRKRLVKCTK